MKSKHQGGASIFAVLVVGMFMLSFVSAFSWTAVEEFKKDATTSEYGKYEIYEKDLLFFKGDLKQSVELNTNTLLCGGDGGNCESNFKTLLLKDGVLFDKFNIYNKETMKPDTMRWIRFEYFTKGDLIEVPNYVEECSDAKLTEEELLNETKPYQICNSIEKGTKFIEAPEWTSYEAGQILPAKETPYVWRAVGDKAPWKNVEWTFTTSDIETWEWATWGNISLGAQAEVILLSPANASTSLTNQVNTSSSANITGGAYLKNVSQCDNRTGTFLCGYNATNLSTFGTSGLVSYYTLDETSGTTAIDSMGLYNGTASNARIFTGTNSKVLGANAGNFSQGNDYITSSAGVTGNVPFSFSAWIRYPTSISTGQDFITMGNDGINGAGLYARVDTNKLKVVRGGGVPDASGTTTLSINTWYHVVYTYNNGAYKVYLNGNEEISVSESALNLGSTNFNIGKHTGTSTYWSGSIDEVGIWNRSLNQTEITALYNSGAGSRITTTTTTNFTNTYSAGQTINWSHQYCDSDDVCYYPTPILFSIDGTAPTISPVSGNGTQNYGVLTTNHTLNYTVTDTNLNACWLNYNGTNKTIPCTSGSINTTNFTLVKDLYNATIFANDTAGNIGSQVISWDYRVFENGQTYNLNTTETSVETIVANFTVATGTTLQSAYINYSGTQYAGTVTANGTQFLLTATVSVPTNTNATAPENKTFFWDFQHVEGSTITNITTAPRTQLVNFIYLTLCGGAYTVNTLNFTLRNETIPLAYEGAWSFGATVTYWTGNGATSKTYTIQNTSVVSNVLLCLASNDSVQISADIDYNKGGFGSRSYYLVNSTLTNVTNNITLWVLPDEDDTNIIIKAQNEYLAPIKKGYVKALRYYPGYNAYYQVEISRTDDYGNANLKLIERDVDYKFLISDANNNLLYTTNSMKVICTSSPCTLEINAASIAGVLDEVLTYQDIDNYFSFNNVTKYLTFTWSDPSGLTSAMRLQVVRVRNYGEQTICDQTITGSSGIIPCLVNSTDGEYLARVYRSASPEKPFNTFSFDFLSTWQTFGGEGLLWMMLFTLTMFIAGVIISPIAAGVLTIGSIVFMMFTGIVYMPFALAISIIIVIILYISKMRG